MKIPPTIRWVGLALLGIVIAAGVSIAASSLASRQIGLASEPISAGDALAPATRMQTKPPRPRPHRHGKSGHRTTTPAPSPPAPTAPPTQTTVEEPSSPPSPDHSGVSADDNGSGGSGADD